MHRALVAQAFCNEISLKPLNVVLQIIKILKRNNNGKCQEQIGTFAMLKCGRNEKKKEKKKRFCVFIGQSLLRSMKIPALYQDNEEE